LIITKFQITSFFISLEFSKIFPVNLAFIILLAFTISIHVKSTEATVTTFIILLFINTMRFLSLFKEVTSLIFAHLKCVKICLFLFIILVVKSWKLCKRIFTFRFILKTTEIRKIKRFLTSLFLSSFNRTIVKICLFSELRKMNRFLILVLSYNLCRNSFFINNFLLRSDRIKWLSDSRKRWSVYRISLWTWYILKLIEIETLVRLFIFDRKPPTLIHLLWFINLRFVFCHCFKRILNWNIFCFSLGHINFFKRTLLTNWIIFWGLFWRLKFIFRCLKRIAWLFIISRKVLARCLKWILFFTFCETFIHLKIQNRWSIPLWYLTFTVILKRIYWLAGSFRKLWILKWILNFRFRLIINKILWIVHDLGVSFRRFCFPEVRIFIIIRISVWFVQLKWVSKRIIKRFFPRFRF